MISALNFKSFDKGSLKGFFDLRYHGMTVKGCRLMTGNNGLWIALPQQKGEQDGETKYFDMLYLSQPEAEHVRRLAIADLRAQGHIDNSPPMPPPPRRRPSRSRDLTPEGEDLSEYKTHGEKDDIPF